MTLRTDDWRPGGECVLGVWAHPDDETYLSAGLMTRTVRAGGRVVCAHATLGERGTDDPARWPPDRLGALRARELQDALAALGVREHETFGYPDGGCDAASGRFAVQRLEELIDEIRPDVVVTFGPDGITGHPDHAAVSRWATAAWRAVGSGTLLYATSTRSFLRRHRALHARLGLLDDHAHSVPDRCVAVSVRLSADELDTKRRALAAHASQTVALATAMGEQQYRHWYDVESFRLPRADDLRSAIGSRSA
jgi:LmbE family N-acetylglucosaminyl deacetylase